VNRARIDSRGIEIDARHEWSPITVTWLQATWLQLDRPGAAEPLRHRPDRQWSLGVEVRPRNQWQVGAAIVHVGERWDSSIPTGGRWLDEITDVQLSIARRLRQWELYAVVDNAFDTDAEETIGTPLGDRRLRVGVRFIGPTF
jgi:vitamin B12 transporter